MVITFMQYVQEAAMSSQGGVSTAAAVEGMGGYNLLPEKKRVRTKDVLLVGDSAGNIHVLEVPKSLRYRRDKDRSLRDKFRKNL